jgi:hypothetical protein
MITTSPTKASGMCFIEMPRYSRHKAPAQLLDLVAIEDGGDAIERQPDKFALLATKGDARAAF